MKAQFPGIISGMIMFFLLFPYPGSAQDLTTGLLAYYPFNGNTNDATGNGNNGTLVNNPTLTTDKAGNPNSAYSFDGVNNYISIPGTNLNPLNALSVAMFFYPTRSGTQTMVGKINYTGGVATQFQVAMDFAAFPGVLFGVNPSSNGCAGVPLNGSYVNSGGSISLNQWHCFVATFDKGIQKIYVDGALLQTTTAAFTTLNQCPNADIQIGSWWSGDLQRFQGKIDEVRIYNRALSLLDVTSFCPTLSCPTLGGTLTGSNTCNGAPGLLTFHSSSGPGPFILTYSDGVSTYTALNVHDGEPFAVQVPPVVSTVYTLLSIQDNSGCPATTAPSGITATINPGNCTLCTGSLGDPIVKVDFGTGNGSAPPLEVLVPGATSVGLTYVPVTGNPAIPTPLDGQYTITNNVPYNSAWYSGGLDHTPGDVNGYMLFENVGVNPGEFFRQKVTGLCEGGKYEFAAWIGNADNPAQVTAILPDLTFIIQTEDGTVLDAYNSGPVPQSPVWTWRQYGFFFTLPSGISTVVIRIIDNNPGGTAQPGNDFAIDDITFRPCGPTSTSSFSNTTVVPQLKVCEGGSGTLYGTLAAGYANPQYLWQISSDSGKTWTNIPNSNALQLPVTSPVTGRSIDYYYRMVAADGGNIQLPSCRITSSVSILTARALPNTDFAFSQTPCTPLEANFYDAAQPGVTYTWNIEGVDHASPPGGGFVYTFPSFGSYPVILKATDGTCPNSSKKTIDIQLKLSDIIVTKDTVLCGSKPIHLQTKPAVNFCWSPANYLDDPASANPTATPPVTTKYYFTANITGPNLIVNGDFGGGNINFTSDYTFSSVDDAEGKYFIGANPHDWDPSAPSSCGDHTSGAGNMMMVNGYELVPGASVWSQQITVQPNTNYAFSTWVQSLIYLNPASLQFYINGVPLAPPFTASATACSWQQFYTVWNSGSNTTANIKIVDQNMNWAGNDFALDDISLSQLSLQRDSVTITVEDPPAVKAGPDTAICPGNPVPLWAMGAVSYSWTPATTLSSATSATPVATPDLSTEYIVTGKSLQGCTATDTVDVEIWYPPYIRISSDTAICSGDNIRLHIEGGASYVWSPAALLDNPASPTPLATLSMDTMFHVAITDANGCPEKDSVKVYIRNPPTFVQPFGLTLCEGSTGVLGRNDYLYYVYSWQPATGLSDPTAPRPVITPAASGQYTVNISDSTCPQYNNTFLVNVTVKPNPIVTATKLHDIDCSQATTQLNASGAYSYTWFPPIGLSDTSSPSPIVSIDTTTTYIVKGTSLNGCYAYDNVTVNVRAEGKNLFVVPNAFSPNGDGHNDCYGLQRWGDVQLEDFSIFNRAGLRVFTTHNPSECWDGNFNGRPQPAEGYVYVIRAKTFCGPVTRTGILMLVR
ncbi:MAG: gliding motility-associated C-terminal domain-containing protein [Chitinophagaceae bacterium]|nr:gliding motility-associated C-terminal domain-containing protein [Chitinophagaceae bacterium]